MPVQSGPLPLRVAPSDRYSTIADLFLTAFCLVVLACLTCLQCACAQMPKDFCMGLGCDQDRLLPSCTQPPGWLVPAAWATPRLTPSSKGHQKMPPPQKKGGAPPKEVRPRKDATQMMLKKKNDAMSHNGTQRGQLPAWVAPSGSCLVDLTCSDRPHCNADSRVFLLHAIFTFLPLC